MTIERIKGLHLCLSGNPVCSGIRPCASCYQALRDHIVPHAMVQAGGPFTERDAPWPARFLDAFHDGWQEAVKELTRQISAALPPEEAAPAPSSHVEEPTTEATESTGGGYEVSEENMKQYLGMMGRGGSEAAAQEKPAEPEAPHAAVPQEMPTTSVETPIEGEKNHGQKE